MGNGESSSAAVGSGAGSDPIAPLDDGGDGEGVLAQLSQEQRDLLTSLIADRSYVEPRVTTNRI